MSPKTSKKIRSTVGEALVKEGAINERILIRNIVHQSHVPYIEPSFAMLESSLLRGVSEEYLQKYLFVPFSKNEDGRVLVDLAAQLEALIETISVQQNSPA